MGKRYLIDSNAVIDFLGGKLPDAGKQMMLKIKPEISIITVIEILSKKDIPTIDLLKYTSFVKASLIYSEINENIVEETIHIRKKYLLKTPDAIIAATAMVNKLTLITRNEKDFSRIYKLNIINPWEAKK